MVCAICEIRRPRRFCPGVRGDICTICCGTEREVTVSCPLDCEYLRDSRRHEKTEAIGIEQVPNRDIRVSENFLEANQEMLYFLGQMVGDAAVNTPGAVDFDVREALEALVRTYRTLQSGVYYESIPANPLAANIYAAVQQAAAQHREEEKKRFGMSKTRDADVLGLLVFLQRLEVDRNNGRRRGRAFVDFLTRFYPAAPEPPPVPSSLILP
ncbi:MAG TPA: hypothetical protein VG456_15770 [Candidatus Sulfopaludibacter sp.]|jgi:hypothetical protein|nr:hypothetical protein [Candidatus Sulfopaludibacter sp.]